MHIGAPTNQPAYSVISCCPGACKHIHSCRLYGNGGQGACAEIDLCQAASILLSFLIFMIFHRFSSFCQFFIIQIVYKNTKK
jgi:hypothetical protein